jgi:hypothetical protein
MQLAEDWYTTGSQPHANFATTGSNYSAKVSVARQFDKVKLKYEEATENRKLSVFARDYPTSLFQWYGRHHKYGAVTVILPRLSYLETG